MLIPNSNNLTADVVEMMHTLGNMQFLQDVTERAVTYVINDKRFHSNSVELRLMGQQFKEVSKYLDDLADFKYFNVQKFNFTKKAKIITPTLSSEAKHLMWIMGDLMLSNDPIERTVQGKINGKPVKWSSVKLKMMGNNLIKLAGVLDDMADDHFKSDDMQHEQFCDEVKYRLRRAVNVFKVWF